MQAFIIIDGILLKSFISGNLLDSKDRKICSKRIHFKTGCKIGELSILNYIGLFSYFLET